MVRMNADGQSQKDQRTIEPPLRIEAKEYPDDHGKSPGYWRQWVAEDLGLNGDLADVRRLLSLGAIHDLELHLLTLTQGAESRALNGGIMYEDIIAIRTFDEPITLCVIEPFYLTSEPHFPTSSCTWVMMTDGGHPGPICPSPPPAAAHPHGQKRNRDGEFNTRSRFS
jgi:hypothetical protein